MSYCFTQEQQFAAQQKDHEEKAIHQVKEQFRQKVTLMERQLTEQKQQVQNSKSSKLSAVQLSSLFVYMYILLLPLQQPFYSSLDFVQDYPGRLNQSGFTGARGSEWLWHQLGHMQICTSPQPHQYPISQFFTGQMPFLPPNLSLNSELGAACGCRVIDCLTVLSNFSGFNCLFYSCVAPQSGYHLLYRIVSLLRWYVCSYSGYFEDFVRYCDVDYHTWYGCDLLTWPLALSTKPRDAAQPGSTFNSITARPTTTRLPCWCPLPASFTGSAQRDVIHYSYVYTRGNPDNHWTPCRVCKQ